MVESTRQRGLSTRWLALICALLLAVLAAGVVWLGVRTLEVKDELQSLVPLVQELEGAADDRDLGRMQAITAGVATHAHRAAELTGDPIWAIGEAMPFLGANFTAVRVVSQQLDAVAASGVPPLLDLLEQTGSASRQDDGLDLTFVQSAQGALATAANVFGRADEEIGRLPRGALLPIVAKPVADLSSALTEAAPMIDAIARASELLPSMMGADGSRSILVMLQNNAEVRTGGGLTGSFVLLRADGGKVRLDDSSDSSEFRRTNKAILPIPESTTALYGDIVGRFVQNTSMTSDFTLTAALASTWWERRTGEAPDTVVSIDPLVLASMLDVLGPAELADGSALTADNLIDRLLVEPYMTLDQVEQSAFQQAVTRSVLSHILEDGIDPIAWASGLRSPIEEGRISLWSRHADEQALLADGALAGPSIRHRDAGADAFAVYLNDTTGGKMDSLLDVAIGVSTAQCRSDGHQDVVVAVTLTSRAPRDAATQFPPSMTGGGAWGSPPGNIDTDVTVAAPPGSFFAGATRDEKIVPSVDVIDNGFPSSLVRIDLAPGEERTAYFRFISAEPGSISPRLITTPLLTPAVVDDEFVATCAN